jgi:hydrogenase maturation protease
LASLTLAGIDLATGGSGDAIESVGHDGEDERPARPPVLVLGIGNILLGDEGVGVRVVEDLRQAGPAPAGVELMDGGTAGMALIDVIAGRRHVIIVDAVKTGAAPGTIVILHDAEIPAGFRGRTSPHALGIGDVLAVLTLQGEAPARLTLIGIEPDSLDFGLELSPLIAARRAEMADLVRAEMAAAASC